MNPLSVEFYAIFVNLGVEFYANFDNLGIEFYAKMLKKPLKWTILLYEDNIYDFKKKNIW